MATNDIARPDHAGKHTLTRRTALAGIAATPFMGAVPAAAAAGVSGDLAAIVDNYNAAYDAWRTADDRLSDLVEAFEPSVPYPTTPKPRHPLKSLEEYLQIERKRRQAEGSLLKRLFRLTDEDIAAVSPTMDAESERYIRNLPDRLAATREAEQAEGAAFEAALEKIEAERVAAGIRAAEKETDAAWEALSAAADALLAYSPRSLDEVQAIAVCMIGKHDRHQTLRDLIRDDGVDAWCRVLAGLPAEPEVPSHV